MGGYTRCLEKECKEEMSRSTHLCELHDLLYAMDPEQVVLRVVDEGRLSSAMAALDEGHPEEWVHNYLRGAG
jgi:hypothetical protein